MLVHGLSAWHRQFDPLLPHLIGWRVLAVDLPGFGRSDQPDHPLTFDEIADELHAALAQRGIARFRLAGHSMGAALCTALAERHPESVERLMLLAPAGLVSWRSPEATGQASGAWTALRGAGLRAGAGAASIPALRRLMFARLAHDGALLTAADARVLLEGARRASPHILANTRGELARAAIADRLSSLPMPVDLIWGEEDRLVPISWASVLLSRRPDMSLTPVHGAGHILTVEQPRQVAAALKRHAWESGAAKPDVATLVPANPQPAP